MAPLVAARNRIAFVVASAAGGGPTDSVELFSVLNYVLPSVQTAADSADARVFVAELVAVAYRGRHRARLDSLAAAWRERTWMFEPPPPGDYYWTFARSAGAYDALSWWVQVRVPVLLVYGEADAHVPARESAGRIAASLAAGGNRDVTVRIFAGADHTFRTPPGPGGWAGTAPDYLDTLLGWIVARATR
jgi:pimeloyl-ACP methyl ester carboxylesterase